MVAYQNIGFFIRHQSPQAESTFFQLAQACNEQALNVKRAASIERDEIDSLCQWADLLIVIGGDGTLIRASSMAASHHVPVYGINTGRIGFLTAFEAAQAVSDLTKILDGGLSAVERPLLQCISQNSSQDLYALNEFVLHSTGVTQLIEFELLVGGEKVYNLRADGLIIATPLGSTAYSLSAGGPILHPSLPGISIVPMLPFAHNTGSIVVPLQSTIEIKLASTSRSTAMVSCDGIETDTLQTGQTVGFKKAPVSLSMFQPLSTQYFAGVRRKLRWGSEI